MMTREQAIPYISRCVDDALAERTLADMPANARLVGWQCGFEPMFIAVWSYLADTDGKPDREVQSNRLDDDEAVELATDLLKENGWFAGGEVTEPDYVL